MSSAKKLHLGCGKNILDGYINVDRAKLDGVDVVHDLSVFPFPFQDKEFSDVIMIDVLEHLPNVIRTLEELHRICKPGARVTMRVPYYNSWDASHDPTHEHVFNENTFDFFDPATDTGRLRTYYSHARFTIHEIGYLIYVRKQSLLLCNSHVDSQRMKLPPCYDKKLLRSTLLKNLYTKLGHKFGNTIRTLHVELVRI